MALPNNSSVYLLNKMGSQQARLNALADKAAIQNL
jgi:hypothetical protein